MPTLPHLSLAQVQGLVGPAFTIAVLGAVAASVGARYSMGSLVDAMGGGRDHLDGLIRRERKPIRVMHIAEILAGDPA